MISALKKFAALVTASVLSCGVCLAQAAVSFNAHAPILPDRRLTPGAVLPVTARDITTPGYSKKVRNVPQSVKEQVYRNYSITHRGKGEYEVDHLVSLEIGGSNSIKNLWPESYLTQPWNAHVKDGLENRLHSMIAKGQIDMATAQREIATDWIAAYKKYVSPVPLSRTRAQSRRRSLVGIGRLAPLNRPTRSTSARRNRLPAASSPAVSPQVWVNTKTGVYHYPGARWYGNTAQGKYLSEAQAIAEGDRAAANGQ